MAYGIIKIFPSSEGTVRAVKKRTLTGEYIQPIVKLALQLPNLEDLNGSSPFRPIATSLEVVISIKIQWQINE